MKEVELPSGAKLKISLAPFADAKALYKAFLKEVKEIEIKSQMEMANVYKNILCGALSSPEIESCVIACLKRCTYTEGDKGELRFDDKTFEPQNRWQDYTVVCFEVMKENLDPFLKDLSVQLEKMFSVMNAFQA